MSTAGKVHRKQPSPKVPHKICIGHKWCEEALHRDRPRAVALCKIRRSRMSKKSPIHKLPYQRLFCRIAQNFMAGIRLQSSEVIGVQEASEAHRGGLFEDANL
ncbi:hypothetical protein KIN20_023818 [Parelaphostrongylus tenuis]|uniref:Core Histone H2A/H2B/H3 domain-containing protein n=1 Tax=Parelaphostrongylus tenuis TaxID=148309 RepID=A0AAD5QXH5_PARTN|nr:hypothetical protein KIN20_023818 [Parelaphostrongylus tenuis]